MPPPRLRLARTPTPLELHDRLSAAWGTRIWVKRDDLTGFGLSGNKVRKLEYHLAAARDAGVTTLITCGAVQSNHCRATALAAARLGLDCILLLRTPDGHPPASVTGNHLLQHLAGAEIRFVDPDGYAARDALMADVAAEAGSAWVIPEGASDGLGMWGFVAATDELVDQLAELDLRPAAVWHAASSGGTTAGMTWAASPHDLPIVGCSVGDPADLLDARVAAIIAEAAEREGREPPRCSWRITDAHVGGGYGQADDTLLADVAEATRLTGLLFDPTYTGKAIHGLRREVADGSYGPDDHVVFWHTGGCFAAFAWDRWPIP